MCVDFPFFNVYQNRTSSRLRNDLLTRMISSSATYDFVNTNLSLVVPRQVSPNLAHALWFVRFLGRRPLLLDRVFLRVCESKAAIPSYARSVAFMATAHTAHCVMTELVPRHWNLDVSCAADGSNASRTS